MAGLMVKTARLMRRTPPTATFVLKHSKDTPAAARWSYPNWTYGDNCRNKYGRTRFKIWKMKKIFTYVAFLLCSGFLLLSCEDADSTFRDFIVEGGLVYPGSATSPAAHPGKNKVLITWLKGTDPSVSSAKVFWDNYTDSVSVPVPPGADPIRVLVEELVEKPY